MQVIREQIALTVDWIFEDNGMIQKSTFVGGLQCIIRKNQIYIHSRNSQVVYCGTHNGSREAKRAFARKIMLKWLLE